MGGDLIKSFTIGRNMLKKTGVESANAAFKVITEAQTDGLDLQSLKANDNGKYNIVRDLISFTGLVNREGNSCTVTKVGSDFSALYEQSAEDAWRWVVTRTLWLYTVPNGTDTAANRIATDQGLSFSFFHTMLGLLAGVWALPLDERFLSYEELCLLLNDDKNWSLPASDLVRMVLDNRAKGRSGPQATRRLLGDLEDHYKIGRDNLNTVFNKAFHQTGLFEYRKEGGAMVAISLSGTLDEVLLRRVRFVLDHKPSWDSKQDWVEYLQPRKEDLPLEVSLARSEGQQVEGLPDAGLGEAPLTEEATRVLAVLKARKNVVLYGPPGTGKTHTAFAVARDWAKQHGEDSVLHVTFHPAFGYEDFVQGFRPEKDNPGAFALHAGPLPLAVAAAKAAAEHGASALMVIDEINRGDVARIFGELITYIEPDKRNHTCRLAQTPEEPFAIPDNLYFLGTMNTADKSVSLLDVALRRRFAFVEFRSDPTAFDRIAGWMSTVGPVRVGDLLEELNKRLIQAGVEADRSIGHALLAIRADAADPVDALGARLLYDVIPLIQEYCYLDRARMKRVLGGLVDDTGHPSWVTSEDLESLLGNFLSKPKPPVAG
jgi:MoxR-like ATPase